VLLLIRWAVPEAINSTSPAGARSNFRMPFDKRQFSHYEYRSLYVRLRFHDDARSSNHYMVVLANLAIAFIARRHDTTGYPVWRSIAVERVITSPAHHNSCDGPARKCAALYARMSPIFDRVYCSRIKPFVRRAVLIPQRRVCASQISAHADCSTPQGFLQSITIVFPIAWRDVVGIG
jgi:hypothetical protein